MEISTQLVKPLIDRLVEEYKDLDREMTNYSSEEVDEMKTSIRKNLQQLEVLDSSMASIGPAADDSSSDDLRDILRQLKLELRFAQRRWKRQLLNEERFKRGPEKGSFINSSLA